MNKHISMILVLVMAVSFLAITRRRAEADGTEPTSCDDFSFRTKRICNNYCEKLECDEEIPKYQILRRFLCRYYEFSFLVRTGMEPPCDPCAELVDGNPDNECPCNYNDVPMTEACWTQTIPALFTPCLVDNCLLISNDSCILNTSILDETSFARIDALKTVGDFGCRIVNFSYEPCGGPEDVFMPKITEAQFLTCLCRLENYANQTSSAGINIDGDGPPFSCSNCGNGVLDTAEVCDDGNTESGDGCSGDCSTVEDGFECPTPGEPCIPPEQL